MSFSFYITLRIFIDRIYSDSLDATVQETMNLKCFYHHLW
jgi:hypothetical protein